MDVRWLRIALDPAFAASEAARTGRAAVIRDVQEWSRRYPATASQAAASGLANALALPLVADGRVVGVLALTGVTLTNACMANGRSSRLCRHNAPWPWLGPN